jgi:hypothetical protein
LSRATTLLGVAMLLASCDPVVDDARSALGPETPGVRQGPLHRPGQPCILCHDGAIGDPQAFSVAGTVFETSGARNPSESATVTLIDANATQAELVTNAAGNFYTTPSQYSPTYPVQVTIHRPGGGLVRMQTLIAGNGANEPNNGSCASCHFDPAGPSSSGHVCLELDDGGTPP